MIQFNSGHASLTLQNLTRGRVRRVDIKEDLVDAPTEGIVFFEVLTPNGTQYALVQLTVRDAPLHTTRVSCKESPTGFLDRIETAHIAVPNGFTNLKAIWDGPGTKIAKLKATESLGLTDLWIHASLTGPVS
jgi:hypothetical protein